MAVPLAAATYNGMHNIAVTPNGDLYIADSWNNCIRRVDAKTKIVSTFAGTGKAGFSAMAAQQKKPRSTSLCASR